MAQARSPGQSLYWQIYAMRDLEVTKKEIERAVAAGYKGFALTVDAIQVGKRERDMRQNIQGRVSHDESHKHIQPSLLTCEI